MPRAKKGSTVAVKLVVTREFWVAAQKGAALNQLDLASYAKLALAERMRRDGIDVKV